LGPYFALQKYHKLVKISNHFTVYILALTVGLLKLIVLALAKQQSSNINRITKIEHINILKQI
jgi:hypothetical protein